MNKNLLTQNNYLAFIENQNLSMNVKKLIKQLINEIDEGKRIIIWKLLVESATETELYMLSNPYFIGFGNPLSEVLFIGQEKAFDIESDKELLLQESINNNFHWQNIIIDNRTPAKFNPKFPRKYHNSKIRRGHTWAFYSRILAAFYNLNHQELITEIKSSSKSVFNYCFMTEINNVPRKKNNGSTLIMERYFFLQNPFYKKFKYVIIGASTSLGKEPSKIIKEIFDADLITSNHLVGYYGKDGNKKRIISIYKSNKQSIILCNQLSGSAGWKDEHLEKLLSILKENR